MATGPILFSLAIAASILAILILQTRAGDNEAVFGQESMVFNQWIRQYLLRRRDAVDRDRRFPDDAYYLDAIVSRLKEVEARLRGDEKSIFRARVFLIESLRHPIVAFESTHQPLHTGWAGDLASISRPGGLEGRRIQIVRCDDAIADLLSVEKTLILVFMRELKRLAVPDWKVQRELEFSGLPFLGGLRRDWRRMMSLKQKHLELRRELLELLALSPGLRAYDASGSDGVQSVDQSLKAPYEKLLASRETTDVRLRELFLKLRFYEQRTLRVD